MFHLFLDGSQRKETSVFKSPIEIKLDDNEQLVRIFKRGERETWGFRKLRKIDFVRNMTEHSGISLFRLKYITPTEAMARLITYKKKGLAAVEAKVLKEMGFKFMAEHDLDPHVSMRCSLCNLEPTSTEHKILCKTIEGDSCLLENLSSSPSELIPATLSKRFWLHTPIK